MSRLAVGRLLRVSLAPSAPADVVAGVLLGAGAWPPGAAPFLLVLASSCVFHGGMALNDWADREEDARTRPDRPLPSGQLTPGFALRLAVALLLGGGLLALAVEPLAGSLLFSVAGVAALYDLRWRGPWLGPVALGVCRAGNLGAGVALGASLGTRTADTVTALHPELWFAAPAAYGLYVLLVSRLGRLEDAQDEVESRVLAPRQLVFLIALVLMTSALVPAPHRFPPEHGAAAWVRPLALGLAAGGAWGLVRAAWHARTWDSGDILPVMGMALRRLMVFSAVVAVVSGSLDGWVGAGLILLGLPLSARLRRTFPPS